MRALAHLAGGVAALGLGGAAAGEEPASGVFDAVGFGTIDRGRPVVVVARSPGDHHDRLKPVIEEALRAEGYRPVEAAPLRLTFEVSASVQGTPVPLPGGVSSTELGAAGLRRENARVKEQETQLRRSQDPKDQEYRLSLDLAIDDDFRDRRNRAHGLWFVVGESGGPAIWQGSVRAMLPRGLDGFEGASRLVPVLVTRIGETAEAAEVPVPPPPT